MSRIRMPWAPGRARSTEENAESPEPAEGTEPPEGTEPAKRAERPRRPFWKELPILVVVALVLALLIKTFLVQAFSIPSGSMENTLRIGDRVLVDKLTPALGAKPSRGEVVVFHDPGNWLSSEEPDEQPSHNPVVRGLQESLSFIGLMPPVGERDLIKRVIGVGGDTVSCQGNGAVYVNGKALSEPYLFPGSTPCGDQGFGPYKVPANTIWVLGDNRQNSRDSRFHTHDPGNGFVPVSDVVGRAIVVAWPLTHARTLPLPDTFSQPGIDHQAAALTAGSSPALLGLVGAVPLTWLNRRRALRTLRKGRGARP